MIPPGFSTTKLPEPGFRNSPLSLPSVFLTVKNRIETNLYSVTRILVEGVFKVHVNAIAVIFIFVHSWLLLFLAGTVSVFELSL